MPKKRILAFCFLLWALCFLSVTAYAHPGKTDGNGGHHVTDTGEYHYHHGHPAHKHYDMDADGDIDCPYDFDDKTDHSSSANLSVEHVDQPSADEQSSFDWGHLFLHVIPITLGILGMLFFFASQIALFFNEEIGATILKFCFLSFFLCIVSLLIGGIFWLIAQF